MEDYVAAFREAMGKEGIRYSGSIEGDGVFHRVNHDDERKGKRSVWYKLFLDERPAGMFGWNKLGNQTKFTWSAKGLAPLTPEARAEFARRAAEAKLTAEAQEAARQARARAAAAEMWDAATESISHPYLVRKGVQVHGGLRVGPWVKQRKDGSRYTLAPNALLIPMVAAKGEIWGLQAIFAEKIEIGGEVRDKDFVYGALKRGLYHAVGVPRLFDGVQTIGLCEGYATGASIYEATGICVVVCFDAGNLVHVARKIRQHNSDARLVVFADNDQFTLIREVPVNVGVIKATEAAKTVGGIVVVPFFSDLSNKPTDWNDLTKEAGGREVKRQIDVALGGNLNSGSSHLEPPQSAGEEPNVPPVQFTQRTLAGNRSTIEVSTDLHVVVCEADLALAQQAPPTVFQYGNALVRLSDTGGAVRTVFLTAPDMMMRLSEVAVFSQTRGGKAYAIAPPRRIAESLLSNSGYWTVPHLRGTSSLPILNLSDGGLAQARGYDPQSGIFLTEGNQNVRLPERPSRSDALIAAQLVLAPFQEFPLGEAETRDLNNAVILSYLLTLILRRQLDTSPLFIVSAKAPGTGKTLLVRAANQMCFGHDPEVLSPITARSREDEDRKRITAILGAGSPSVLFDNYSDSIGSDAMCAALTSPSWTDRTLGKSEIRTIPNRTVFAATGNNLTAKGDMARRCLLLELDARLERPEGRAFAVPDLVGHIRRHRSELLGAIYTILRGYIRADAPPNGSGIAGFDQWNTHVHAPVGWLGFPNPVHSQVKLLAGDHETAEMIEVLEAWHRCFGHEFMVLADVHRRLQTPSLAPDLLRLQFAFETASAERPKGMGKLLHRFEGRPMRGLTVGSERDRNLNLKRWRVVRS